MKKIVYPLIVVGMIFGFSVQGWAAENATRDEVITKCMEAAKMIGEKGIDAAKLVIGDKNGPFVWKDTYVFLMDMDAKMLAHPIKPELTQKENLLHVKDTAGKPLFLEFVELANSRGKGWVDYMWPKPGQEKPAEKSSFIYRVPGTQYLVGAGIYK
jgi:signal transduction histidine kinase